MRKTLLLLLLCSTVKLYAQSNTVSSGGQASGTGGSVGYTIGQIAYSSLTGTNGSLIQGVQQPFEISIVTNITDLLIDLNAQVYPNPTTDQLILSIKNQELKNLQYVLVDIQGKRLKSDRINNVDTNINVSKLSNGTYFLRILSNNKQIKTFQIVKNK
jgi:hypothetical protein